MPTTEIKKAILPVSVATLIGLIVGVVGLTMNYSNTLHQIDTRIITIESQLAQGGRFTTKDGSYLQEDIDTLKNTKADRSDLKVIEVKLANIEAMLVELKQEIKN